jgi:hypothetical protein
VRRNAAGLVLAATLLVAAGVRWLEPGTSARREAAPGAASAVRAPTGDDAVTRAFREHRSGVWLSTPGRVSRVLPDDEKGARHQRFILTVPGGTTILVSHNIDLAPRVDGIAAGDDLTARGLYVWNEQGGVLHWTHHDPDGRQAGGWIRHGRRRYE